jgi:hypothetical protein
MTKYRCWIEKCKETNKTATSCWGQYNNFKKIGFEICKNRDTCQFYKKHIEEQNQGVRGYEQKRLQFAYISDFRTCKRYMK